MASDDGGGYKGYSGYQLARGYSGYGAVIRMILVGLNAESFGSVYNM